MHCSYFIRLEIRYPVILSPAEKIMAQKIVTGFKQNVCGFDILRVKGKSYCCDVNGFSFVKNSRKYYDDCSEILSQLMWRATRGDVKPRITRSSQVVATVPLTRDALDASASSTKGGGGGPALVSRDSPLSRAITDDVFDDESEMNDSRSVVGGSATAGTNKKQDELRCVIAVIRHGDRTPKQKMKIKVTQQQYIDYFHGFVKSVSL
jgi:inositol hexakisphosphate/diphosphoinositol-pentakisphosphate kinase